MGLDGVEALEIKQRLDSARAGGIAVEHRLDIDAHRLGDAGLVGESLGEGLADEFRRKIAMMQPLGDAMGDGLFQPVVVQHRGIDEARQRRLGAHDVFGLRPDGRPERIEARKPLAHDTGIDGRH